MAEISLLDDLQSPNLEPIEMSAEGNRRRAR